MSGKAGQRCQERTQLSARIVTAGDEVHVILGGHRPAIIGSTNPVGELQQAGVEMVISMFVVLGTLLRRKMSGNKGEKDEALACEQLKAAGLDMERLNGRVPITQLSDLDGNYANSKHGPKLTHESPSVSLNKSSATLDCWRCCIR